jgi:putative oxidoreductase
MFENLAKNTLVPLVLRLGLAVIFIFHGYEKIGQDWGADWAKGAPNPPGAPVQMAVAWGEFVGGIAMAIGLLTRLAALGLAAIMVGAIVQVHWQHGFSMQQQGFEYNFAILVICAGVFLLGAGTLSVDRIFRFRRREI